MNFSAHINKSIEPRKINTAALILAAGRSSRFKGHKLKTRLSSGICLLEVILMSAEQWNISELAVVLGPDTAELENMVRKRGFKSIVNNRPELGMGHSLKTGLRYLVETCNSYNNSSGRYSFDALVFTPADIPMIMPASVNRLIAQYKNNKEKSVKNQMNKKENNESNNKILKDIIIPVCNDRKGHPPLIGSAHFYQILGLLNTEGPNSIARKNPECVQFLDVNDPGILRDIDTPDDYNNMSRKLEKFVLSLRA